MTTFTESVIPYDELVGKYNAAMKVINTGKLNEYVFESLYDGGEVTVMILTGEKFKVKVKYTSIVADVQEEVQKIAGISTFRQRLIFGGERLAPHRSLYHYLIPAGGIICLVKDTHPNRTSGPWTPSNEKDIIDDNYYIDKALSKLITKRSSVTYL